VVIYPQNFEQKTGFDKIRRLIAGKCLSPLGEERVREMSFSTDHALVTVWLSRTDEFMDILRGDRDFPSVCYFDLRPSLKRIRPEGTFMDEKELFDLRRSLQTIHDIAGFLVAREGETPAWPHLSALASGIRLFPAITAGIDAILDKFGRIRSDASPALLSIRREMADTVSGISRSLQSILRLAQAEGVVEKDVAPTMRDGRLMIPVATAFKRRIRGIVHDESASGKTVFIEPEAVVEANNRIRELEGDERREIVRVLTGFTDTVRPQTAEIARSYEFLADIEFIRAKALFAVQINAIRPDVTDAPGIDWVRAVHPLLYLSLSKQGREVTPLDIMLEGDRRLLLISGPNAGGKSVCLTTVGLLQYMLQCGLPIPVDPRSRAGMFSSVFIDIGDEQSIENDLSTYSSHLINMKFFLRHCNQKTILLIDEFGSGTEPTIGGAIAEALLDRFNRRGAFGVITTHYQNLKKFAQNSPGIVNGAMLYDRELMQPLFQLSIGSPGSSFAIEIARKTGLPEDVIRDASAKVGSDYVNSDKYLQDIARDKRYWESKRQTIHRQEKTLEDLAARYAGELETLKRERSDVLKQASDEAARILAGANATIENTIREIKESQAGKEETRQARKSLDDFKASVGLPPEPDDRITRRAAGLRKQGRRPERKPSANTAAEKETISPGDLVRLRGQRASGTVLDVRNGKQATVAFGMIKSVVSLGRLEKARKGEAEKEMRRNTFIGSRTADEMHEKKLNFRQELDVRGMRGDEAVQAVTYFIDDACLAGASPVRILHGTGSGILRQLIRDYLATAHGVGSYHDEHVQFGGSGITVVELL
jgi:DNA mismatch repair protein MutS2